MINCLFVGFGGFIGAVCRYLLGMLPINGFDFPFTTLLINFLGAVLIGAFSQLPILQSNTNPQMILFLTTGICGGFTTFSTFSLETVKLFESGRISWGLLYIFASVILCLGAILLGRAIMRALVS